MSDENTYYEYITGVSENKSKYHMNKPELKS